MVHEWALAEAVAEYVKGVAGEGCVKIVVSLGELQAVDEEVFRFALNEILKELGLRIKELIIEREECVLRCRRCGHTWRLSDLSLDEGVREAIHFVPEVVHSYVKCPKCGSRDFEVIRGRGVWVREVVRID